MSTQIKKQSITHTPGVPSVPTQSLPSSQLRVTISCISNGKDEFYLFLCFISMESIVLILVPLGADPETKTLVQVVYCRVMQKGAREGKAAANNECVMKQAIMVRDWNVLLYEISGKCCRTHFSELLRSKRRRNMGYLCIYSSVEPLMSFFCSSNPPKILHCS